MRTPRCLPEGTHAHYLRRSHDETADLHCFTMPWNTESKEFSLAIVEAEFVGCHPGSYPSDTGPECVIIVPLTTSNILYMHVTSRIPAVHVFRMSLQWVSKCTSCNWIKVQTDCISENGLPVMKCHLLFRG